MKLANVKDKVKDAVVVYRYDLFALTTMLMVIILTLSPLLASGQIVFSDMAFGFSSDRYMEEIWGVWNERWSTSTLLNVARLLYILPIYLLSQLLGGSGPALLKGFVFVLICSSALSMYLFTKRIVSVYHSRHFDFFRILALITGALFYALNPWVIFRIQHIYLLCGYSLFPLVLMFFFNAFDPKFQGQLIRRYRPLRKGLYRRNVVDLFLLALVFTISAAAIHYFFYGLIFLVVMEALLLGKNIRIYYKIDRRRVRNLVLNHLYKMGLFGVFFATLSAYWLSMYVGSILFKAQASQHNINVVDTLSLFSRNSSVVNVLYMDSYWWPMFNLNDLPTSFYLCGGLLIAMMLYAAVFTGGRYSIIAFFSVLNLIFLVVSTGVELNFFASIFVLIVTKTPVIGTVFRDPNKLVGLMAIGNSVLLTFGLQSVLLHLDRLRFRAVTKATMIFVVIAAFIGYDKPFLDHFVSGFYSPVAVRQEYLDLQDNLKNTGDFDSKLLYVPIADNMTQSTTGVATPYWNINADPNGIAKATGDIQVYSSQKNTIFHHEGNTLSIMYYMNFLQYLLDKGLTSNMGLLASAFGVDQLAYHNEYLGQETRQNFNELILANQKGLTQTYANDIFTVYDVGESNPYMYAVGKKILTPYGYSRMESFADIPNFNLQDYGVLYTTLGTDGQKLIDMVNAGDYLDIGTYNDLLLSTLPTEDYLLPFEAINDGNAFLKWSKTLVANSDWLWYLSSQNMNNFAFDFDYGAGVAVTFATSKFDVLPYNMDNVKGKLVLDFDSMLKLDKFFVADNPQILQVQANPRSDIPAITGQVMKGDPKNIWQVAKSGILDAKENTPYRFNIVISGRGVDTMHLKARFYDENMIELGASYVVAPADDGYFDSVNFTADYVSPAGSRYMRIDILSFQKPEQTGYWWIHDVHLWDYSDYAVPNVFTMTKNVPEDTRAGVYVRTLMSAKGGRLGVTIGDKNVEVNTISPSRTSFEWQYLGKFDFRKGDNTISVENLAGFNGVNLFAVIPETQLPDLQFTVDTAISRADLMNVMEAEYAFDYRGNIQSDRTYPELSMGRGISSQNGELTREIDVVKSDRYSFAVNVDATPINGGSLTFSVHNTETGQTYTREITAAEFSGSDLQDSIVVDRDSGNDVFPQVFKRLPTVMSNPGTIEISDVPLVRGRYLVRVSFNSRVPSVSTFTDLHKFDPTEIAGTTTIPDPYEDDLGYCDCATITPDMMRNSTIGEVYRIDYDATCAKSWYEYASQLVPVQPDEEYLFHASAISEQIVKRHMKVLFLDENKNIIDVTYINDVEEKYKDQWNTYEQIVKVPDKATYLQFHVLTRGNKQNSGYFEMKDYSIVPYHQLITVDSVVMFEGSDYGTFLQAATDVPQVSYSRTDSMKRTFTVDNPAGSRILLNIAESPNPLWVERLGDDSARGVLAVNGVTTGFFTDQTGDGQSVVILRTLYYGGLVVTALGFLVGLVAYRQLARLNRLLEGPKRRRFQ